MSSDFDVETMFMAEEGSAAEVVENQEGAGQDEETTEAEAAVDAESEAEEAIEAEDTTEEAQAGSEAGDDAETLKALKPKAIKRFNQMLSQRDEALAARRAAEAERDAIKAQLDQKSDEPIPVAKSSNPLAAVTNEEQLDAHENFYRTARSWLRSHPNGGVPPVELTGGREIEFDSEMVGQNLDRYETLLESAKGHREFLQKIRAERAKAREVAPEMFKAGSPEHAAALEYHRKLLNFDSQSDRDIIIAKLLKADRMEREEREGIRYTKVATKAADKPAPAAAKPQPKPAPAAARAPVMRAAGAKSGTAAAWERVNAPGGSVDIEELMDA